MTFNPKYAFEVASDGLAIEDGATILSGSGLPNSIIVTVPCYYLRTNGEIYYHTGSGSWTQVQTSAFDEDQILVSDSKEVLISQSGDVLRGM